MLRIRLAVRTLAWIALLTQGLARCQTHVTMESAAQSPMGAQEKDPILSQIRYLDAVKWDSRHDDAVESVIAGARANFADYFRCNLSQMVETKLVPIDGEPILAARWPGGCGAGVSEVRLWDEPYFTTYFFRLPKEAALHSEALAIAVEDLMWWLGMPGLPPDGLKFQSIRLPVFRPQAQQAWLAHGTAVQGRVIPRQFHHPGDFFAFWLHGDASTAWFSVSLGKLYVHHYPPDMMWIRERFPPLRIRLTKLPKAQIIEQVSAASCFSEIEQARCKVLVAEALRRDPNSDEFRSLLSGGATYEVLMAAHKAGILPRYRDALVAHVAELASQPPRAPGKSIETPSQLFWEALRFAPEVDLKK